MCIFMQPFDTSTMKRLSIITSLILLIGCNSQTKFPEKMSADFKIEYHLDGGMENTNRTIVIKNGECLDEGRADGGPDYKFVWTHNDQTALENLYAELKKLNAFGLNYKKEGQVNDRGGEYVSYTIDGKTYEVNNSQSNFIENKDEEAFKKSIDLILKFVERFRPAFDEGSGAAVDSLQVKEVEIDSTIIENTQPEVRSKSSTNDLSQMDESLKIKNKGIPAKMPNDFKIKYEMSGGISGSYRNILIQYGSSTDEGKQNGESKYTRTWINKNLKDYENLYNGLYKLNVFTLEYASKGKVADRGGEKITFTINKKDFVVSDKDSDFMKNSDKAAFKKAIGLILAYAENGK